MVPKDTYRFARNLHRLPRDITMVHPLVDGMGKGIYENYCPHVEVDLSTGDYVDKSGVCPENYGGVKPGVCGQACLWASIRDINSCRAGRTGTTNVLNGLQIDIFVPPRPCGNPPLWWPALHQQTTADYYGWQIPVPEDTHAMFNGCVFSWWFPCASFPPFRTRPL